MDAASILFTLALAVFAVGIAIPFVGSAVTPGEVRTAKLCFLVAAGLLVAAWGLLVFGDDKPLGVRVLFGLFVGGVVFVGLPEGLRWISHRQTLTPARLGVPNDRLTPEAPKVGEADPSETVQPAASPAKPIPSLPGKDSPAAAIPYPAHLTRQLRLSGFEPNLVSPPSGERSLDSYTISFDNTGNDMIRPKVKSFSLSADGSVVLTAGEGALNFLASGQTQSVGVTHASKERIPLASGTKEMIAEIRIDYDTVPPTGVRHVYRKVRHVIHWPEEGRSLWLETNILDEGED